MFEMTRQDISKPVCAFSPGLVHSFMLNLTKTFIVLFISCINPRMFFLITHDAVFTVEWSMESKHSVESSSSTMF